MPRLIGKYKKISPPKPIFEIGSSSANSTPPSKPSSNTALNKYLQDLKDGRDVDVSTYFTQSKKSSKPPSKPPLKPPSKPASNQPSETTPLLINHMNSPSKHLPKMVDEFLYLDAHLTKLTKREEML